MPKYILILFPLLVACSQQEHPNEADNTPPEHPPSKSMTMNQYPVVFYNVENLFDTQDDPTNPGDDEFTPHGALYWDEERYHQKLEHLEQVLFMPDSNQLLFAGLAEVENRTVLKELLQTGRFRDGNFRYTHFDSEDHRGIDCAFLYDASHFQPITETRYRVEMEHQPHFRTRDILYIHGTLEGKEDIHVFVNHWSSRREGQHETEDRRIAAAMILRRQIDILLRNDPMANVIVMGDFNDTPTNKSMHQVLRAKGQHELQSGDLVNLLIEEQKHDKGTIVYRGDWQVFDQLIVSQGLLRGASGWSIEQNNAWILDKKELLYTYKNGDQKPNASYGGTNYYGGFSDHLPVYLLLRRN